MRTRKGRQSRSLHRVAASFHTGFVGPIVCVGLAALRGLIGLLLFALLLHPASHHSRNPSAHRSRVAVSRRLADHSTSHRTPQGAASHRFWRGAWLRAIRARTGTCLLLSPTFAGLMIRLLLFLGLAHLWVSKHLRANSLLVAPSNSTAITNQARRLVMAADPFRTLRKGRTNSTPRQGSVDRCCSNWLASATATSGPAPAVAHAAPGFPLHVRHEPQTANGAKAISESATRASRAAVADSSSFVTRTRF